MENLRTGCERTILWKMTNQHNFYNKEMLWSRQIFQKTDIARKSIYLRTISRKLTLNLKVIFNSLAGISFLKYFTEIYCVSYCFQEKKLGEWGLWETSKENFPLKLRSSNVVPAIFFWKFAEVLGQNLKSSLWKIMS